MDTLVARRENMSERSLEFMDAQYDPTFEERFFSSVRVKKAFLPQLLGNVGPKMLNTFLTVVNKCETILGEKRNGHWMLLPDVPEGGETSFVFSQDYDCRNAEMPLSEYDLFSGSIVHPDSGISGVDRITQERQFSGIRHNEEPFCQKGKDFSVGRIDELSVVRAVLNSFYELMAVHTVTRFQGIRGFKDLKTLPELSLRWFVLEGGRLQLRQYGLLVSGALTEEPKSWVAYLLASK